MKYSWQRDLRELLAKLNVIFEWQCDVCHSVAGVSAKNYIITEKLGFVEYPLDQEMPSLVPTDKLIEKGIISRCLICNAERGRMKSEPAEGYRL